MASESLMAVKGSARQAPANASVTGAPTDAEQVTVTVVLHRKNGQPLPDSAFAAPQASAQFASAHGANPRDIERVEAFAHQHHLTVVESSAAKRRVILKGSLSAIKSAFAVQQLACYRDNESGKSFRGREGTVSVPQDLEGSVMAVLGIDDRPVAKPHFRRKSQKPHQSTTFTPLQVAELYGFPTQGDGSGQTIAIIELGGGYSAADLATYFRSLGVKAPNVTAISVDGGANTPGGDADGEVMLDIEVAGAIAPGANIAVYFTPNTDQGFVDAITNAVHDTERKPSVISISWGAPEDGWTEQARAAMDAALQDAAAFGVTVTVASGDNGSTDGAGDKALHVDFPASSPFALACGGTTLSGNGGKISKEVVWNETAAREGATGGGVSKFFALPAYQKTAKVPAQPATHFAGRGVPDVAGNADPSTGYQVLVDGQNEVVGGTSAVAPLWAALVALLNQQLGRNVGFLNPSLYALGEKGFHDVKTGNNDDGSLGHYKATSGWDPCTGLGTPNGTALLSALSSSSSAKSGK